MRAADAVAAVLGRRLAWRLGRALYMAARGEAPNAMVQNGEARLVERLLGLAAADGRGFVAFDVGANVGDWSAMALDAAARIGATAEVHAFEPVPETFATLSCRLDARPGFCATRAALSDREGEAAMRVVGPDSGVNSLLAQGEAIEAAARRLQVPLQTAAGYAAAAGVGRIDLLKIDAEGHDLAVLRGAEPLLAAGRVAVAQFEYNWRWLTSGASLWAAFALAERLGLAVARLGPARLEVFEGWSQELDRFFEGNYALVRRDVLARLPHVTGRFDGANVYVGRRPADGRR